MSASSAIGCPVTMPYPENSMAKQPLDDGGIEKALTDYQEGMRLKDGVRTAAGMRMLQSLEGSNLDLMSQMLGQDPNLDGLFIYYLKFFENNAGPKCHSLPGDASAFLVALAAGDAIAVTKALSKMKTLKGDDLEILALLLENSDHFYPYALGFVQRRTGPPVDPLAKMAKWFKIYEVYRKVPKTITPQNAAPKKRPRKAIIGEVIDKTGFSKSLILQIVKYFDQFKK
jgi:hypothetical protein